MQIEATNSKIEQHPGCVAAATAIMGNKWTPFLILLLSKGSHRFSTLQNLTGISPRTLSQRLDELEENAILTKTTYPEVPPRVEYALTQKGADLIPILKSMAAWGDKYQAAGAKLTN
ncbi:MAG TPA: helix-turn-helix domain-containing protein [Candidatus Saccharimonadales bacterium]|nr:helix-turn-helix domain-containing protein [Candidatus Saccharimonadales bacterium]